MINKMKIHIQEYQDIKNLIKLLYMYTSPSKLYLGKAVVMHLLALCCQGVILTNFEKYMYDIGIQRRPISAYTCPQEES